jgi:DNA polymerase III subunit alpha
MNVIPLFKSNFSIGRSILTLEKSGSSEDSGADSIIDLALANGLKEVFLVDDTMSGVLEAYKNCVAAKLKLIYGIRLNIYHDEDISVKTEESLSRQAKYIIFAKNFPGYQRLIKIFSCAAKEGFYYEPRINFKKLKEFWSEQDLNLCVPFYDSFLFNNSLMFSSCVPDFSFINPTVFIESNDLPFDDVIRARAESYAKSANLPLVKAKSVFYAQREDFKAYLTYRCLCNTHTHKRADLNRPELPHMTSKEFCLESWKEQNAKGF